MSHGRAPAARRAVHKEVRTKVMSHSRAPAARRAMHKEVGAKVMSHGRAPAARRARHRGGCKGDEPWHSSSGKKGNAQGGGCKE